MKIKSQLIFLSSMIISIPILFTIFMLLHTYIHSPGRYLIQGSDKIENSGDILKSLELLPQDVEAIVYNTQKKNVLYSTIPEIKTGSHLERHDIWDFIGSTSDKYFYQFIKHKPNDFEIIISRLDRKHVNTEKQTRLYLKILLMIIIIAVASLILILFIYVTIFKSISKVESTSMSLAEGKLDKKIVIDSSALKSNEVTLILQNLEKMRRELVEVQNRKNRFIMGISHDLRTPVAVIKGYCEAISDDVITDNIEIKQSLELIDNKASQLEEMIDTLINFMKLNNTEIKQKLEIESITDIIKDFAKYVEVTGTILKRKIITQINLTEDIRVPLNSQLVHRSFENIFSNAVRYTNENGTITIKAFQNESEKNIFLQIIDDGIGIDEKDLPNIFDMFYRGTNSRREEGMGIGLSVVKNIMETHGWKISVDSVKNKGTCFSIKIPY